MARKEQPVKYGTRNKSSKKRSTKMNSEPLLATISKSNLESLLHDGILSSLGYIKNDDEVEVKLDLPDLIPFTIKHKEVAH